LVEVPLDQAMALGKRGEFGRGRPKPLASPTTARALSEDRGEGSPAIFHVDSRGRTSLLVAAGEFLEVAPGDHWVVSFLNWSLPSVESFNDRGELVFNAFFRDRSTGLFRLTVPEPSTHLLRGLALIGVFGLASLRSPAGDRPTRRRTAHSSEKGGEVG
jgi:hypothetical protein